MDSIPFTLSILPPSLLIVSEEYFILMEKSLSLFIYYTRKIKYIEAAHSFSLNLAMTGEVGGGSVAEVLPLALPFFA